MREYLALRIKCIGISSRRRIPGNGSAAALIRLAGAFALLTGCTQPGPPGPTSEPVTGFDGGSTISPQTGAPAAASSDASGNRSSVVGAGSFPRSFLIPGTDTSIRIGGY